MATDNIATAERIVDLLLVILGSASGISAAGLAFVNLVNRSRIEGRPITNAELDALAEQDDEGRRIQMAALERAKIREAAEGDKP